MTLRPEHGTDVAGNTPQDIAPDDIALSFPEILDPQIAARFAAHGEAFQADGSGFMTQAQLRVRFRSLYPEINDVGIFNKFLYVLWHTRGEIKPQMQGEKPVYRPSDLEAIAVLFNFHQQYPEDAPQRNKYESFYQNAISVTAEGSPVRTVLESSLEGGLKRRQRQGGRDFVEEKQVIRVDTSDVEVTRDDYECGDLIAAMGDRFDVFQDELSRIGGTISVADLIYEGNDNLVNALGLDRTQTDLLVRAFRRTSILQPRYDDPSSTGLVRPYFDASHMVAFAALREGIFLSDPSTDFLSLRNIDLRDAVGYARKMLEAFPEAAGHVHDANSQKVPTEIYIMPTKKSRLT